MFYRVFESKFGEIIVWGTDQFVEGIQFYREEIEDSMKKERYLNNNSKFQRVSKEIDEYLHGKRKEFSFSLKPKGTDFQNKVWTALKTIPYGETRTYKDIAIMIGNPKASRAIGMANNKNPIMIAVPCHRVIGSNGKLVGYAGGVEIKKRLLEIEEYNEAHSLK